MTECHSAAGSRLRFNWRSFLKNLLNVIEYIMLTNFISCTGPLGSFIMLELYIQCWAECFVFISFCTNCSKWPQKIYTITWLLFVVVDKNTFYTQVMWIHLFYDRHVLNVCIKIIIILLFCEQKCQGVCTRPSC